jgi:dienelactone hydrolase
LERPKECALPHRFPYDRIADTPLNIIKPRGLFMKHFLHSLFILLVAFNSAAAQQTPAQTPAEVRASFLKLLDRPKVPADVQVSKTTPQTDGWVLEEFTFATEKKADGTIERVPAIMLRPEKTARKLPAVIVLHGTGGAMQGSLAYMKELQARGIVGVAIDARYHGRRSGGAAGATAYNQAIAKAWKTKVGEPMERPFYFDTVWDLWRLIDVLAARPDIDADRLGMIGFSMGGIQTWLAASVDQRVRVSVPAIAVQSFKWSLDNEQWQGRAKTISLAHETAAKDLGEPKVNARVCKELWNKIIPGILDIYDCPNMLRLFADRPLMILNGTKDPNCPIEGARVAIAAARKAYADAGATEKLEVLIAEVGHTVTNEQRAASLAWFERWLTK